jgi:transcriptional regulator with XRE-family HTH domain
MATFVYRRGIMTGSDEDEHRAYLKALGGSLKIERVRRGLSQDEFADLIGLSRTFYGRLERGQCGFNIVELPGIARALGVRQADLLPEAAEDATAGSVEPSHATET